MDFSETRNWSMKILYVEWLSMNKETAYRKILRCVNEDQIRDLGRYLDKIKHKYKYQISMSYHRDSPVLVAG